jgi:hypothetical protein
MNRFTRKERDVRENQIYRDALLAQPPEFFRQHFGIEPNLLERIRFVERMIQTISAPAIFVNDVYNVRLRNAGPFVQLDIARFDNQPCNNWRDFQRIKNELVGPECEGVELFPAESRLVDTANQYHLWVNPDPKFRFEFGYQRRVVFDPVFYGGAGGEGAATGLPLRTDNTTAQSATTNAH